MNKKFLSVVFLFVFVLAPTTVFAATSEDRDPERVLARVEDYEIKEMHVDQILAAAGPQAAMMYNNEQGRLLLLNELIANRLFALYGKKQGLDETPEFKNTLNAFITHSMARMAIDNVLESATVTDEDIKNFYDENPDHFTIPEQIHAVHILIPNDENSEEKLALLQRELEQGVSFSDLAMEHSACPSAQNGGSLGFFGRGQMVPEFEEAAFALNEPGDISEPVQSNFGWHIIKLEEIRPSSVMPFEGIQQQIEQFLLNEKQTQKYQEVLENLMNEFTVEILAD